MRLLWSQALTIALVVASGIGGFLASLSAVDSLALARDSFCFYDRGRFADVFATVKRTPDALSDRLREMPGVTQAETTVETTARITLTVSLDQVVGQLIGLDGRQPQRLNLVTLRAGRLPRAGTYWAGNWRRWYPKVLRRRMALYRLDGRKARLQTVEVAARNATMVSVRKGLAPGQAVMVCPPAALADGRTVQVRKP